MTQRLRRLLLASYVLAFCVIATPFVHERLDHRNLGFPLFYGVDYEHYVTRLEQGLTDPGSDTGNGIFSVPDNPPGLQPGGLEGMVGILLSFTGWTATTVMVVLVTLFGATVVPLLQRLLVRTGLRDTQAVIGSFLYFFLFLSPIERFVHSSWSLPLALSALLLLWRFWERPTLLRAVLAGLVIGILPHVYYWGWTFVWCVTGLLTLAACFYRPSTHLQSARLFAALWLAAAVVAAPYFLHIVSLMGNPYARETAERSSVVFSRGIESYPRSILTFLLGLCAYAAFLKNRTKSSEGLLPVVCLAITTFIVLHQQWIHGEVISFSTHYYPYICLAALIFAGALIAHWRRSVTFVLSFLLCTVFLGAAYLDYPDRSHIFQVDNSRFMFQHFSTLLPVLTADPHKEVVLTDLDSALMIAAATRHDVVYTDLARHLLISTKEYAERFCLSEVFAPVGHPEWIPHRLEELSRLGRQREAELSEERMAIAVDACKRVRQNPLAFLQFYRVTLLLWNEKDHPDWLIDPALFTKETQGDGWSLWRPAAN